MAMDLEGVLAVIEQGRNATQDIALKIVDAYGAQSGALGSGISAVDQRGKSEAVIAEQEQRGLLTAQQNTRAAATAFGTNMDDPSQIVSMLGQDMRASYARMKAQQARVNKIEQGATLSNPLGLLTNIVIGDEERAKLQSAENDFNLAANTLQSINQATQQTARTNLAIAETKSEASVQAELDKIEANAKIAKAELGARLAGVNVQMLQSLDSLNARQTSMAVQMYQLGVQEEQRTWMRSMREAEAALKSEDKAAAEATLAAWNKGRELQGQPPGSSADLKLALQLDKENANFLVQVGYQSLKGSSVIRYGPNAFGSMSNLQRNNIEVPPTQQPIVNQLDTWLSELTSPQALIDYGVAKGIADATTLFNDKKNAPAVRNEYLVKRAAFDQSVVDPKNEANIYTPPPIDVLKNKPYLLENKFLASELAPSVEAGGNIKFNPSQLLSQAKDKVLSGEYSTSEIAEGLSWAAQQLALTNNATKNYLGFGLPPITDKYVMPLSVKAGPYAKTISAPVNLLDPVQVTAYFQRVLAAAPKRTPLLELTEQAIRNSPFGDLASSLGTTINEALERNRLQPSR